MIGRRSVVAAAAGLVTGAAAQVPVGAPTKPGERVAVRNVVLVHGAFADGSSWAGVVAALQAKGLRVIAVQNPLTSLADDVAATKRAMNLMDGPMVLAGHSYGGTVISEAGDDPRVVGLVFVAALAPEAGEAFGELAKKFPAPPGLAFIRAKDGFAQLDPDGFVANFCQDVPPGRARVMAASQGPVAAGLFDQKTSATAWKSRLNWYAVSTQDRMVAPEMQRFYAKRMGAKVMDVHASHASPVSRPADIARLIEAAAAGDRS